MERDRQPPVQEPRDFGIGSLFWRIRDAAVVAHGDSGRIVLWNHAAEAMFGYTAAEALTMTVDALVPVRLRDQHRAGLARYAATGHGALIDGDSVISLPALRKSGQEFAVELSLSPLPLAAAERHVLAIIRDATDHARTADERTALATEHARLLEKSHTLQAVAAELASVRDTDALLQGIVDHTMAVLGVDGCAVWLFDEARLPRLNATRGLSEDFHNRLEAYHGRQIAAGTEAALTGQPVFVADLAAAVSADDPAFAATLRREGLVSGLRLPLREPGGQVAGWLTLYHRRERLYSEDEVRLAQAFTDQIAVALRNARLTEQERAAREDANRRLERVTALARITEQLLGVPDSDTVLRVVVEAAARLSGTQRAIVSLIEGGDHRLRPAAAYGSPEAIDGQRADGQVPDAGYFACSATRQALTQRRAVAVDDYATWPDDSPAAHASAIGGGVRAVIAAPLLVAGSPIGILWVGDPAPRRFAAEDVALVQALADQAALTMEHTRLAQRDRETAVLEERARLARDLHDSVTQSIFSLGMLARAAQTQHERGAPVLGTTLARVGQLAQEALTEMRALLVTLRPVALDEEGFAGALEKLTASFQTRTGLAITCRVQTDARPAPDAETAIFRIVQEALANVAKHARASEASVTLTESAGVLTVTVADDGCGFDPAVSSDAPSDERRGGIGLRSMRERAAGAGITLRVASAPGAGTTITIAAPVIDSDHAA